MYVSPLLYWVCVCECVYMFVFYLIHFETYTVEVKREISSEVNNWYKMFYFKYKKYWEFLFLHDR